MSVFFSFKKGYYYRSKGNSSPILVIKVQVSDTTILSEDQMPVTKKSPGKMPKQLW
jgi:hypothetical protein